MKEGMPIEQNWHVGCRGGHQSANVAAGLLSRDKKPHGNAAATKKKGGPLWTV